MKITDPQVIKNGEKNLIAAVQKNLDLKTVKHILKDRMAETAFSSKGGQIVVHDNQIAFRLDFDLKLSGSLVFDRLGNYIPDSSDSAPASGADISEDPKFLTLSDNGMDDDDGVDDTDFPLEKDMDEIFSTDLADEDDLDLMPDDQEQDLDLLSDDDEEDLDLMSDDDEEDLDLMSDDANIEDLTDADLADDDLTDGDPPDADHADLDDMPDDDGLDPDDRLDDDIDDILKESREFWEQKKGS